MAHPRHYHMSGSSNAGGGQFGDTTYTKIFVGGLAWETQRDTMSRYFEQFGGIQEAVVITDKNTGRSKGYGFVTFKDPESAKRACQDPNPVIDGRRANCNLAILGASSSRSRTALPPQHGLGHGRFRQVMGSTPPSYHGGGTSAIAAATTGYFQHPAQYTFPYSLYGYSGGYSHLDNMYPMNYYNISGTGQNQFPPYFTGSTSGPGTFYNFYHPYYGQFAQSSNASNVGVGGGIYGLQHPQMLQYSGYTPQQYITGILSIPSSIPAATGASLPVITIGQPSIPVSSTSAAQQNPSVTGHDHR